MTQVILNYELVVKSNIRYKSIIKIYMVETTIVNTYFIFIFESWTQIFETRKERRIMCTTLTYYLLCSCSAQCTIYQNCN